MAEPTVRKIVALLQRAGFPRSDVYRRDVWRDGAATGFRAWTTRTREAPGVKLLAVAHFDAGQDWDDESWAAHKVSAQRALMRYADAITAGGYIARLRFDREDPVVLVFGKEASRG